MIAFAGLAVPEPVLGELGGWLKIHVRFVGAPVDVSLKSTVRLAQPDCGEPTNFATGGTTIGAPPPGTVATTPSFTG